MSESGYNYMSERARNLLSNNEGGFCQHLTSNFCLNKGAFNSLYNHDKALTLLVPIIICKFSFGFYPIENVWESVSMSILGEGNKYL